VLPAGSWPISASAGEVTLAWDDRHRRRILLESDQGLAFLLDLHRPARLREGDGLQLEDGRIIRVRAAAEPVLEIRAGTAGLTRLAYHLGNRHLDLEIAGDVLVIRADPVIAEMVRGLGGTAEPARRPFTPEAGAYESGPQPSPGHGHGHHHHHHDHD
jgi:urease accessory protein